MRISRALFLPAALAIAVPGAARDSLGLFDGWAAFRDPGNAQSPRRCYAIALPDHEGSAYLTIGFWPAARVRGQFYVRFPRAFATGSRVDLVVGDQRFALSARGDGAWATDARADAAIVAAMRGANALSISGRDAAGRAMSARWALRGAASAIDAAALGCAR